MSTTTGLIHRPHPGESAADWRERLDSLPWDAVIEILFPKPLRKAQAVQLVLLAGYYANAGILADSKGRIVGLQAPKAVWDDIPR